MSRHPRTTSTRSAVLAGLIVTTALLADQAAASQNGEQSQVMAQAIGHFRHGRYEQAIQYLTVAIRTDPQNSRLYDMRGNAYTNLGWTRKAQADNLRAQQLRERRASGGWRPATGSKIVVVQAQQTSPANQPPTPPEPEIPTPEVPTPEVPTPDTADIPVPTPDVPEPTTPGSASAPFSISRLLAGRIASTTGAPSTSISTDAAGQTAPPVSTGELLQQAPSVSVRRTSALDLDPRVRGYRSSQINASANGMTQIKTRIDIDSLFSGIDPGIVRNLEVIDGPYSSLYGMGFAFLVADLYPTQRYDQAQLHASTRFTSGLNGRTLATRENIWGGGKNWGVYGSFGLRTGNDYHAGGNSFEFRVPASYHQWDGFFTAGFDVSDRSRVEYNYTRNEKNNVELPGVVYDVTQSKSEQFNLRYVMQEDPQGPQQAVVQYWWSRTPYHGDSTRESKQRTFYQSYIANVFRQFGPPFDSFNLANTFARGSIQTSGARALLTWGDVDSVRLTGGVDWRRYEQFYSESHVDATGQPTIVFGDDVFGIPKSSIENWGLLAHLEAPVGDNLDVTLGGRYDQARAFVHDDAINAGGTEAGKGAPNETLGMGYATAKLKVGDHWTINAGGAYAMRMPTLAELYSDSPFVPLIRTGNAIIVGNSELTPERNLQFDLGATGQWENVLIGARSFHSTINNYILFNFREPAGNPSTPPPFVSRVYEYTNLERATLWGGDAFAEVRLLPWLSTGATMGYVKGTNHSPVGSGAEGLPGIYPFSSTVTVRMHDPDVGRDRWGVAVISRMVIGQSYVADTLFEAPTGGFTTLGLRGYFKVNEHLRLTSSIQNLGDRTYTEHESLSIVNPLGAPSFVKEPGLNWLLGMELEY